MANKMTSADLILTGALEAGFAGVKGWLGKYSLSFFRPDITSMAGGFGTFAGVGLIAAAITLIPRILSHNLMNSSSFLDHHPYAKSLLANTSDWMLTLGATALAAMAVGLPPFGATVMCMMVLPTILTLLSNTVTLVNASLQLAENEEPLVSCNM